MFASLLLLLRYRWGAPLPARPMQSHVRRLEIPGDRLSVEVTLVERLTAGDRVLCLPGDVIPCDGEVVDGASVVAEAPEGTLDEGTWRSIAVGSPVAAGSRVISDFVVVRIGSTE